MSRPNFYPASFCPPAPPATASCPPDWVLLDDMGYIADQMNSTTAETSIGEGCTVRVTFFVADPPRLSYFCVYCPDLELGDEPCIICSGGDMALLQFSVMTSSMCGPFRIPQKRIEYFIYRAGGPECRPSLEFLPIDSYLSEVRPSEVLGLVPDGDGRNFVLAALKWTPRHYELHVFSSVYGRWSNKPLLLETSPALSAYKIALCPIKVITLGGGLVGWVDLWRGILLCNVLDSKPRANFIPLPKLLPSNQEDIRECWPRSFRDVTCTSESTIKCVELEFLAIPRREDVSSADVLHDSDLSLDEAVDPEEEDTYEHLWRLVTWHRAISSDCWYKGSMLHVDDIDVSLPEKGVIIAGKSTLKDLMTSAPTLGMVADDVVYLMSKAELKDQKAWLVTLNMTNKTVEEMVPFSAERFMCFRPTYFPCVLLSKRLNVDSDGSQIVGQKAQSRVSHVEVPLRYRPYLLNNGGAYSNNPRITNFHGNYRQQPLQLGGWQPPQPHQQPPLPPPPQPSLWQPPYLMQSSSGIGSWSKVVNSWEGSVDIVSSSLVRKIIASASSTSASISVPSTMPSQTVPTVGSGPSSTGDTNSAAIVHVKEPDEEPQVKK